MVAKMGVAKSRVKSRKRLVITCGGIAVVLVVVFALLYFTNRPNYRDLEKEFARISANIPADWQLVSESSNKGTWGLFCLQIEGSECPHLIAEFRRDAFSSTNPTIILQSLEEILSKSGFQIRESSYQKCTSMDISSNDYTCNASGYRDNIEASLSFDSSDSQSNSGDWSYISLSKYEK
jgi:hypothetical protein